MIMKVCDICGKVENPEKPDFHTFTHVWRFAKAENFHICSECMTLIKELRRKQNSKRMNDDDI